MLNKKAMMVAASAFAASAAVVPAQAQVLGLGTHSVGGAFHGAGVGFADMITNHTDLRMIVQPFAGPSAWMPELAAGTLETGLLSAVDAAWAYQGEGHFEEPVTNMRMLFQGNQLANVAWVVRSDSDITSLTEMPGRRAVSDLGGVQVTHSILEAELKSVGIDWDDLVAVPVTDLNQSLDALREQRVDVAWGGAPESGPLLELDASIGVRVLPFGDLEPSDLDDGVPEEMQAILDEVLPGSTLTVVPAGTGAVHEDTVTITYPLVVVGTEDTLSEDAAYSITKAVWENSDAMAGAHPWLASWGPDTMLMPGFPTPYHEGSVRFYEEIGVWTEEMEERQQMLLAQQ